MIGKAGFSCWELICANSRKSSSIWHGIITFPFLEYKQLNIGKQDVDV